MQYSLNSDGNENLNFVNALENDKLVFPLHLTIHIHMKRVKEKKHIHAHNICTLAVFQENPSIIIPMICY